MSSSLPDHFRAFRIFEEKNPDGSSHFERRIVEHSLSDLPPGEVLVKVYNSALNYKDALSASGHKGITRRYPHTPGIDAAGVVAASDSAHFSPGQPVIATSYDLGMNTDGGFGEYIRVPAAWVLPLPETLDFEQSMALGTAGLTVGIALEKLLRQGLNPSRGPIVVTGASGGVGSIAVALLSGLGYEVWAVSGSPEAHDLLTALGAARILPREAVSDDSGRPLLKPQWAAAIDTVGGNTLATLIKACQPEGSIAVCGLVASHDLHTTVYPFLLNGVNLLGVESATYPKALRKGIWDKLATVWQVPHLDLLTSYVELESLSATIDTMLSGRTTGRIVLRHLS